MERLTAEDRLMLWPDEVWPQEIAALAVLDGSGLRDPTGRVRVEVVREVIEARLHLVPRFRQLLYSPRRGLGVPLWTDAAEFDLTEHVRTTPVPAPGDEAALLAVTERLRRRRLDHSRPLWEMWLLPGLAEQRIGLFVKMHHAIADGIAGVATVAAFLDATPDAPATPGPPWRPAPGPTARELLADNLRRHVDGLGRALSTVARPVMVARQARAAWPAIRELFAADPMPAPSLNRMVGADRTLALVRGDLNLVKEIAHRHGATVNDVLLAITAGGLRGLLHGRGEPVDGVQVRTYVPVTLRPAEQRGRARGNLIGQMVVSLPVGTADPGLRLEQIAAETTTLKARSSPSLGAVFGNRIASRALLAVLNRRPVNVTTADLPGPRQPVYLAGARLLEVFPVLPLIANVSLGVGALSYGDQFSITVIADRDAYPDLDVFATTLRDDLRALAAAASPAGTP